MISILSAIAIPSWLSLNNRQRVNVAQGQILQALRATQARATQRKQDQSVTFSPGSGTELPKITLFGVQETIGNGEINPGTIQITVNDPFESDNKITFDRNGNLKNADEVNFTVTVVGTNGYPKRCVRVRTILGAMSQDENDGCP